MRLKRLPLSFSNFAIQSIGLLISAIVAVPILFILLSLFTDASATWIHIKQTVLSEYLINTALLMLQVAIYTLLIGVSTAWLVATTEFPGRRLFAWALMLPLAAPAYIVAYVYTDLLDYSGPIQTFTRAVLPVDGFRTFPEIRSLPGAAIIISLVLYPYIYLIAKVAFTQRSATLFDAARCLGSSPTRAFFKIALPAARPAIVGGLSLVLMETLADFGVVDYFGVPTFSTGIFRTWFSLGDKAAATKLAAVMFLFVMTLVALEKSQRNRGASSAHARDGGFKRIRLKNSHRMLAALVCFLPIFFGCVVPFGQLLFYALTIGDPILGDTFLALINNSVTVSVITALLATVLALMLSFVIRRAPTKLNLTSVQIATLGYALPGAMLAVGLLAPISQLDRWLAEWMSKHLNWQAGLLLTGTVATLVYAYIIRFLTVAFNPTSSGVSQVSRVYSQAARSLGVSGFTMHVKVHFPLIRRSIFTAVILVFVDTMRELPATLLLRPFNFETLATRVYRLASDERLAEASTAALTIVVIGLIPVLLLNRLSRDNRASS